MPNMVLIRPIKYKSMFITEIIKEEDRFVNCHDYNLQTPNFFCYA